MQRRNLLALGVVSAAVLAVGGGALALMQPGLRDGSLSPGGRDVFAGAARGLLDGSLPAEPQGLARSLDALLARVDALVAGLPPHVQSQLSQLLAILASSGGRRALTGLAQPWPQASVAEIQQALQTLRLSAISLRQQAYHALHEVVGSAFFSDAQTWGLLGYPGPRKV